MRGMFGSRWSGALLALLLLTETAAAFPPSSDERRTFAAKILQATKELTFSATPDSAKARKNCGDARDIMRRVDRNDYWAALVEDCFGSVEDFDKNKVQACDHYNAAVDKYQKVRNDPNARNVEADIERIKKAHIKLGCAQSAAMVTPPPQIATAPLTPKDLKEVVTRATAARQMLLLKHDLAGARALCREAQVFADRYQPNAFASGIVEECFGEADLLEKKQQDACTRFGLAMTHYTAAKPNETGGRQAATQLLIVKRSRTKLGC